MKLIIDITKDAWRDIQDKAKYHPEGMFWEERKIANGTPIPDNATNGNVISAIFPNGALGRGLAIPTYFTEEWWNSPYQKGGTEEYLGGELYEGEFENK